MSVQYGRFSVIVAGTRPIPPYRILRFRTGSVPSREAARRRGMDAELLSGPDGRRWEAGQGPGKGGDGSPAPGLQMPRRPAVG